MRIQIQRTAEALNKGHRSAADSGVALRPSLLAIPGLNGAEKHRQKSADVRSEGSLEEIVTSHRIPPAAQYPQAFSPPSVMPRIKYFIPTKSATTRGSEPMT